MSKRILMSCVMLSSLCGKETKTTIIILEPVHGYILLSGSPSILHMQLLNKLLYIVTWCNSLYNTGGIIYTVLVAANTFLIVYEN